MGNCLRLNGVGPYSENSEDVRTAYIADGSIPLDCKDSMVELRLFLDDTEWCKALRSFAHANKLDWTKFYSCWTDIQDYKSIDLSCVDYQQTRALYIYKQHMKPMIATGNAFPEAEVKSIECFIYEEGKSMRSEPLPKGLFDVILWKCLSDFHRSVFTPFAASPQYREMKQDAEVRKNIGVDDFEYIGKIGEGGYGLVVHGKKRSTGVHYAIKIQNKDSLLKCYTNPKRVMDEVNAMILCVHPFIIQLEYAFHTPIFAIMVMELSTVGTLHDAHSQCENFKMSLERVCFYAAEIILALSHIHRLGLIYRDLKSSNVLLCSSGHIKLVDLGGTIDPMVKHIQNKDHSMQENGLSQRLSQRSGKFSFTNRGKEIEDMSASISHVGKSRRMQQAMLDSDMTAEGKSVNASLSGTLNVRKSLTQASITRTPSSMTHLDKDEQYASSERIKGDWKKNTAAEWLLDPTEHFANIQRLSAARYNSISATDGLSSDEDNCSSSRRSAGSHVSGLSVMGTHGYMAPEMKFGDGHYSKAIDWWTLGILMFELLYDRNPFYQEIFSDEGFFIAGGQGNAESIPQNVFDELGDEESFSHNFFGNFMNNQACNSHDFLIYFQQQDATFVAPIVKDFLGRLLTVDTKKRLGTGRSGVRNIKRHGLFSHISWNLLEQRMVTPPFIPVAEAPLDEPQFGNFNNMVETYSNEGVLPIDECSLKRQKAFDKWNHVSANAMKIEVESLI